MASRTLRSLSLTTLTITGTVALGVAPVVLPAYPDRLKTVLAEAALLTEPTEAWVMGGSGTPIPSQARLENVWERYINPQAPFSHGPGQPVFAGQPVYPDVGAPTSPNTPGIPNTNPLFTPEGLYPLTGTKTLELDSSLQQGVQILDSTVLANASSANPIVVLGYSQSGTIASLAMKGLALGNAGPVDPATGLPTPSTPVPADALNFVLLGSTSNPDGGLLARFDLPGVPLTIPSVGVTFSGGMPTDLTNNPFDTAVYTQEYDGFADFPKYPLNLLADINAFLGIMELHGKYPTLTPTQVASAIPVDPAAGYDGHSQFFMIPTENLPLLDPLRGIPIIGTPLADLLQPDLKVLINLGYGADPDIGWSTSGANLSTPFGLFPQLNLFEVLDALGKGTLKGIGDFFNDIFHPATGSVQAVAEHAAQAAAFTLPSLTDVVNALSGALSTAYSALLPTADIVNFLFTTLPVYELNIFFHDLFAGDLIGALGMPLAAGVGLTTMAAGFEFEVITNTLSAIGAEFSGLFS